MSSRFVEIRSRSFEQAWLDGSAPPLVAYLTDTPPLSDEERRRLLIELICIDLEFRWKRGGELILPLADYARRFPVLGDPDEWPIELIAEEYRVRHRFGDGPSQVSFLSRFRERRAELFEALVAVDRELAIERGPRRPARSVPRQAEQWPAPLSYGDYVLQKIIGSGGSGKVYRAIEKSSGREVAIKYLRKQLLENPEAVERFLNEAETVARLDHPAIVRVRGVGTTPAGGYFIVMDLLPGPDLARVATGERVKFSDAERWVTQACEAVDHAHRAGIVHCDLKPANLVLNGDGGICVTDFGLARRVNDTAQAAITGTAAFMAPEQVSSDWGTIGPRTDVFGLGAVLYTLLTGQPPWPGHRVPDILAQVISNAEPRRIATQRLETPAYLIRICMRCLAKDPADRFASAVELRDALLG